MGRKKVEVRKKRIEPYPLQLCVMISPELLAKIETTAKENSLTKSQAARLLLEASEVKPKYTQLAIA
jgi:hypothetical protein